MVLTFPSIGGFGECFEEAFYTFIFADHLVVEEGDDDDFPEVEFFHVVDEYKANGQTEDWPTTANDEGDIQCVVELGLLLEHGLDPLEFVLGGGVGDAIAEGLDVEEVLGEWG